MPAERAVPPVTPGAPSLRLFTQGLLSKWGFSDGDPFIDENYDLYDAIEEHRVHPRRLLAELVRRFVVPALDQAVEVEYISTSHNPIRATSIDGVAVPDGVHYGRLPEPVELTPDCVEVPYARVIEVAAELRGQTDA